MPTPENQTASQDIHVRDLELQANMVVEIEKEMLIIANLERRFKSMMEAASRANVPISIANMPTAILKSRTQSK